MTFRKLGRCTSYNKLLAWVTIPVLAVGILLISSSNRANAVFPDDYNNSYTYDVVVNDKGWSAWVRNDKETGFADIFLDNGHEVIQLSDTKHDDEFEPDMSKNAVVWSQRITGRDTKIPENDIPDSEIYLYRGGKTTQITDNDLEETFPRVNDKGTVVWLRGSPGDNPHFQIILRDGGQTRQISDNYNGGGWLALNERGWVAWLGSGALPNSLEVFLYNGAETIQITNDNKEHKFDPKLSDNGQIVWSQLNELYLYDSGNTIKLHTSPDEIWNYVIGNKAVAWSARDAEGDMENYLYDGTQTIQLTDNSINEDMPPKINDNGWVTWESFDGNDWELFLWDGNEVVQLTDDQVNDENPQINNIRWDAGAIEAKALATRLRAREYGATAVDDAWGDDVAPQAKMSVPFVSTKVSGTTRFKVRWSAFDPAPLVWQRAGKLRRMGSSGIKSYTVRYRPSTSRIWRTWKSNTNSTHGYFTGKPGITYYFRVKAEDNAGNIGWSRVSKTIVPFNEGMGLLRRIGFNAFKKFDSSRFYMNSVRYSYQRDHAMVYKLPNTNGIGLIATKGPNRGKAKIYVDGKHVKTVDAYKPDLRPRQLIFYKSFKKKRTHWLKIVNLGTPGRSRFDIDGVAVAR